MQGETSRKDNNGSSSVDQEPVLRSGSLNVERKGKLLKSFFALRRRSFDYYDEACDYEGGKAPRNSIRIRDIERFAAKDSGFSLSIKGEKRAADFIANNEVDSRAWVRVFEQLLAQKLGDAFVRMPDRPAAPAESGLAPKDEEQSIHEGTLLLLRRGKEESRYLVLYEDRFEYYSCKDDFQKGEMPRGRADLEAVTDFKVTAGIMLVTLGERKLELKSQTSKELTCWTKAWHQALDRESSSEDEEEEEKEEEADDDAQDMPKATKTPSVPNSKGVDPKELVSALLPLQSDSARRGNAQHETNLIYSGRFTMTSVMGDRAINVSSRVILLALREDRLEYFAKSLDSVDGVPDGTIKTEDIDDLEVEENGFIIHTHTGWNYRLFDPIDKTMDEWLGQFSQVFGHGDDDDNIARLEPASADGRRRARAKTEGVIGRRLPLADDSDDDDDYDEIEPSAERGLDPKNQGADPKPVQGDTKPVIKPLNLSSSPGGGQSEMTKSERTVTVPEPRFAHNFKAGNDDDLDLREIDVQKCAAALLRVIEKTNDALHHGQKVCGKPVTDIKTFFQALDTSDRGKVDSDQLISGLRKLGVAVPCSSHELLFMATQVDKSGGVQLQELSKVLSISTERAALRRTEKIREEQQQQQQNHQRKARRLLSIHAPLERTQPPKEQTSEHSKDLAVKKMLETVHNSMRSGRSLFGRRITDASSLFSALDRNSNGTLERDEVANGLKRLGCVYSEEQLARLFNTLESINDNGDIDLAAFAEVLGCEIDDDEVPGSQQADIKLENDGLSPRQAWSEGKTGVVGEHDRSRSKEKSMLSPRQAWSEGTTLSDEVGLTLQQTLEKFDFAIVDKNGDGQISPDEWEQFQRELVSSVGASRPAPGEMEEPESSPYETLKAAPTTPKRFSFTSFPIMTIHEGPVEFGQASSFEKMHGVLYRNKIEFYASMQDVKGGVPVTMFAFDNLEKVKASKGVFQLWTGADDLHMIQLRVKKGYEGWKAAWEEALGPIFKHADGVWTNESAPNLKPRKSILGHTTMPIHEGPLKLVRRGYTEVRYFVVYEDRFEHYTDATSAHRGLSSGGRIWAVDVRSVRVVDNAFIFGLEHESLDVRVPVGEEMESWIQAFQTMFHQQDAVADGGGGIDSFITTQRANVFRDFASTKQAIFAENTSEMADERVQTWLKSLPDRPVFSGLLGFQYQGKLVCRMSILFKDRLDSWSSPLQACMGAKVASSVRLADARGVETISGGFILNLGGRKVGIHVGDNASLHQWSKVLIPALVPHGPSKRQAASPSPEPRPVNAPVRTPVGNSMRASPRGRSPPREVRPEGWVPRVATLKSRSSANHTGTENPRTTLVHSHENTGGRFGRFKFCTDKGGMGAGKAIHGSATALLATSSRPGLGKYLKTEIAPKIGQSSTSPRSSSAMHDLTPKVGSEDRVLGRRRDSLSTKIGEADRKPLMLTTKSASQPVINKVTDAGREPSGLASRKK